MKIVCKLCDMDTLELRVRNFISNVCPSCEREIGVRGFPLEPRYTVDYALKRRVEITVHDHKDLLDMAESNGV